MKKQYITHSPEETEQAAKEIASELSPGWVVALYGDLGAGKTVFSRGFARALNITEPVSSPTFTIVQEYPCEKGVLYHLDLYRIDDTDAALAFGVDEFLYDKNAYALVEWPERLDKGLFPKNTLCIRIERGRDAENERILSIEDTPSPEKKK
ncbi:MAG: tRNA (adenosine(37)-N6)-threonylcarbamoyltransferase complex ATPase subunit type 1 TsaE [Lentisphaeria bacterium]|nr:tRNA (adenosine(37)-N6)-threonylcarbamoyltransferase complex ATPase subunit type 1 TsaE [Lentisphaeria bacterium]